MVGRRGWSAALAVVAACALTGCGSHRPPAGAFNLFNDTPAEVTVTLELPLPCAVQQMNCSVWSKNLAPGKSLTIDGPTQFVHAAKQLVVSGVGLSRRCLPDEPLPATAKDPTFDVSGLATGLC